MDAEKYEKLREETSGALREAIRHCAEMVLAASSADIAAVYATAARELSQATWRREP